MERTSHTHAGSVVPCLVLLLAACDDGSKKTAVELPAPAVTVVVVAQDEIRPSITFTGRVQAKDKVDLRARVEGFLEKRLFDEGQDVKAGDLLFVIEKAPYKAEIEKIDAGIRRRRPALELADVDRAAIHLVERKRARSRGWTTPPPSGRSARRPARQKASLSKAELKLGYTDIRAPIAGRIGRANISVGNFVGPSSGTLATIVSQDPIYVTFPVTQRELLRGPQGARQADPTATAALGPARRRQPLRPSRQGQLRRREGQPGHRHRAGARGVPQPDRVLVDGQLVTVVAEVGKPQARC